MMFVNNARKILSTFATSSILCALFSISASADTPIVASVPQSPVISKLTNTAIDVSWKSPINNPQAVVDYELRYAVLAGFATSPLDQLVWSIFPDGKSTATHMTIKGLSGGETYGLQVRSISVAGSSEWVWVNTGQSQVSVGAGVVCTLDNSTHATCFGTKFGVYSDLLFSKSYYYPTSATQIVAGGSKYMLDSYHACGLLANGYVMCWGNNSFGQIGITGVESVGGPGFKVKGISNATQLNLGRDYSCALVSSGQVMCWGKLPGDTQSASVAELSVPRALKGIPKVNFLGSGDGLCFKPLVGNVHCYIGGFDTVIQNTSNAIDVNSRGGNGCAVLTTGAVKCWNLSDIITGNPDLGTPANPVTLSGITNARHVVVDSEYFLCALLSNQSVVCLGNNMFGTLGNLPTTTTYVPVAIQGISNVTQIASNQYAMCAALRSQEVYCWGSGFGYGETKTPVKVAEYHGVRIPNVLSYQSGARIGSTDNTFRQVGSIPSGIDLDAHAGIWKGNDFYPWTFQWFACSKPVKTLSVKGIVPSTCKAIKNATEEAFTATKSQKSNYIAVLITGKDNEKTQKVLTSTVGPIL